MNVSELITALQKLPADACVVCTAPDDRREYDGTAEIEGFEKIDESLYMVKLRQD